MTAFIRMLHILCLVPQWPRMVTATQLQEQLAARGHRVTIRSIQRILILLSAHLPLECNEINRPYGWRWERGASPARHLGLAPEVRDSRS